jgi:hypothetical protein
MKVQAAVYYKAVHIEVKDACGAFAGSSEQASPLRVEEESSLLMHIFLAPLW